MRRRPGRATVVAGSDACSSPVRNASCWIPTAAANTAISTYTSSDVSSEIGPRASRWTTDLVSTAPTPNSAPPARPNSKARRAADPLRAPSRHSTSAGTPIAATTTQCHVSARSAPGLGSPTTTNSATATVSVAAHAQSDGRTARPDSRALSGSANISESTNSGCTSSSDPTPRAAACRT
ncbi:hypothetical protein A6F56_19470 [Prescottella equi]|nr:hypothetical protein A6F56_19470 [Prescottella equi]